MMTLVATAHGSPEEGPPPTGGPAIAAQAPVPTETTSRGPRAGRLALGDPAANHPPDNGMVHYGAGLFASICRVADPQRREVVRMGDVTCPDCKRIKLGKMKPRRG